MTDETAGSGGDIWRPSGLRVAVHELGHAAVRYFLTGRLSAIYVYSLDGEYCGQVPAVDDEDAAGQEGWQNGAAYFYGGWAAVHLAIEAELLPREPTSVEATPGDHGFLGAYPADEGLVAFAASKANPADEAASIELAKETALGLLRDCIPPILSLAEPLRDVGFLEVGQQRTAFAPFRTAGETAKDEE